MPDLVQKHLAAARHEGYSFCSAEDLTLPAAVMWRDYWRAIAPDGRAAPRSAVDVIVDRPRLAPYCVWVEVQPGGRYFFKLAGDAVEGFLGLRLGGRYLDEIDMHGFEAVLEPLYAGVAAERTPRFMRGAYGYGGRSDSDVGWEASLFPIARSVEDPTVGWILVGMAYADR